MWRTVTALRRLTHKDLFHVFNTLQRINVLCYDMSLHSTYLGKNTNSSLYGKVFAQTVWFCSVG